MTEIDPANDTLMRFVVWHYAYDPARRERRNQVVTAFDNSREFEAYIDTAGEDLRRRQNESGVDSHEYFGGMVKEPDHDKRKSVNRELGWKLRNGTATEKEVSQAPSLGFLPYRDVRHDD